MIELPKVPSELLAIAIRDITRARKDEGIRINMGTWHTTHEDGECSVCLAGAVLHYGFPEIVKHRGWSLACDDLGEDNINCIEAINKFRCGDLRAGCARLGIVPALNDEDWFLMSSYSNDRVNTPEDFRAFMKDLRKLQKAFKEAGQ